MPEPSTTTGTQTNVPNNYINTLGVEDTSERTNQYGVDFLRTDTNRDITTDRIEDVVRDIDTTRDTTQELLSDLQRAAIDECVVNMTTQICGLMFTSITELQDKADKVFDAACSIENRLTEQHKAIIEDAKCQFYETINREFVLRARTAGSSRNSFVLQQQDRAFCDMVRKLASLAAELRTDAIKTQQDALVAAHAVQVAANTDAVTRQMQAVIGLWSILKGALATTNDVTNVDDVANSVMSNVVEDNTDQTRTNINWVRRVADNASGAGTYTFTPPILP